MTAAAVTTLLLNARYRRSFALPRYTPHRWFECDVFELTPANCFREYEIKMTRANFRADVLKKQTRFTLVGGQWTNVDTCKHDRLAARDVRGPSRFWFVTPAGLVQREELPEWAGWIEIQEQASRHPSLRLREVETVRAPQLHRQPAHPDIREHARGVCYYRMHDLLARRLVLSTTPLEHVTSR